MSRRLKILLSAYACEPGRGSEPEVGWQWARRLAQTHEVTVLTRPKSRPSIEAALAGASGPQPRFRYFDLPVSLRTNVRGGWRMGLHYVLWQAAARWCLRRELGGYDLVHHLTFNAYRLPGFWWWCPCPVLLGPLGGGQVYPWRFLPLLGWSAPRELVRSWSIGLDRVLWPWRYWRFRFACRILVANQDTARRIPGCFRDRIRVGLETGLTPATPTGPAAVREPGRGLRCLWIGRLVPTKGLALALRALGRARQQQPALRLTVVGDGPSAGALRAEADRLGVGAAVDWRGEVPFAAVNDLLAEHDIFLFTSLRDTSGNVLLEAMGAGLPVITLAHQGAAEITSPATACRVAPTSMAATVAGLAAALVELANDPARRRVLGEAGRRRVQEQFLWERRVEAVAALYHEVVPSPAGD